MVGKGGGQKNQNFKIVLESSVVHHWKAGVLRFLKTYYTICLHFCKCLPIYEVFMGGGLKKSIFQNRRRIKSDTPLESWCSKLVKSYSYGKKL